MGINEDAARKETKITLLNDVKWVHSAKPKPKPKPRQKASAIG